MTWDTLRAFLIHYYAFFGLCGSLFIMFTMLVTGLVYRGKQGETYSVFNHYISELGEVGVSQWALLFNLGLIVGGTRNDRHGYGERLHALREQAGLSQAQLAAKHRDGLPGSSHRVLDGEDDVVWRLGELAHEGEVGRPAGDDVGSVESSSGPE